MVRETLYPPSHADLVDKAITHLRTCHPNAYKSMTEAEIQEEAEGDAARCERYARILIEQGVFESKAWNDAVREMILNGIGD